MQHGRYAWLCGAILFWTLHEEQHGDYKDWYREPWDEPTRLTGFRLQILNSDNIQKSEYIVQNSAEISGSKTLKDGFSMYEKKSKFAYWLNTDNIPFGYIEFEKVEDLGDVYWEENLFKQNDGSNIQIKLEEGDKLILTIPRVIETSCDDVMIMMLNEDQE